MRMFPYKEIESHLILHLGHDADIILSGCDWYEGDRDTITSVKVNKSQTGFQRQSSRGEALPVALW